LQAVIKIIAGNGSGRYFESTGQRIQCRCYGLVVMSTELICPECGGVIGGDPTDGGKPCTCFQSSSRSDTNSRLDIVDSRPDLGELDGGQESSGDTFVEKQEAPKTKVCCQCGKDLNGQRRLRDSRGYWCYACHKLDNEANKPKGEKCEDCGRIVAEAALNDYEGKRICGTCREDRRTAEREKRRLSPVKTGAHDELAKKKLLWLVVILAVLALIIILRQLKIIGT
jgi:hypothetical protein